MLNRGAASAVPAGAISEALQLHTWTLTIGLAQARKAFWRSRARSRGSLAFYWLDLPKRAKFRKARELVGELSKQIPTMAEGCVLVQCGWGHLPGRCGA